MAGQRLFVLIVFIVLTQYSLCKENFNTAEDLSEDALLVDEVYEDKILQHEVSERAIKNAKTTFKQLKLKFFGLLSASKGLSKGPGGTLTSKGSSVSSKLDMVFVMDKSGSIGLNNFNIEKQFVENLIEYFPVFPAKTRVAIVSYSTSVKLEFNFNKYINKECFRKGIKGIGYTGGSTATGTALQYVRNSLIFNAAAGARNGAKKVVFVLTDGRSNRGVNPATPAGQLKSRGVIMFALGVTNNVKQSELLGIATSSRHVLHVADYATLNEVTKEIQGDLRKKCRNGQTLYDECGRRCKCENGKLVKCCRLRKEFLDMNYAERVRYIKTVKTASTHPDYKVTYDNLLTIHRNIFFSGIHVVDFFLPWHRWFILQYENLLRQIDCQVTVPYWDWSLVGAKPFSSDVWNTGPQGFGGDGVGGRSCVNTGPFRAAVWSLPASAGGGCLRRDFSGTAPDAIAVANLISSNPNPTHFLQFEELLRVQFHGPVHCNIDGTMCTNDSATAPEFFLHHGFIDKIWWDWQKQSNAHKFNTYFLTQTQLMTSTPYRSRDFLDLNNQPDCACAEYIDPSNNVFKSIKGMTRSQLQNVPRLPLPALSIKASKLFRTTSAELKKVAKFRVALQPKQTVSRSSLGGTDAKLGFKISALKPITIRLGRLPAPKHTPLDKEKEELKRKSYQF